MGGGDKALRLLGGRPLLDRVIARIRPQVEALVLNANGDPARFARFGLPVVRRQRRRFRRAARRRAGRPRLDRGAPPGLRLCRQRRDRRAVPAEGSRGAARRGIEEAQADLACAASGGQAHPVIGLWPVRLREDLRRAVVEEGIRKVDHMDRPPSAGDGGVRRREPVDPFFNANRPEDLAAAAALLELSETP